MLKAALFFSFALAASPPSAHAQPKIAFFGDSLTAGYGLSEELAYPALVAELLAKAGLSWQAVNAGVSGDTTAGAAKRLDWILESQPQAIFVALGANDGLRGVPPEETEKNLSTVLRKAKASGAQVFLAGMQLPTNYGAAYNRRFAAIFPRLAQKHKVELLPFLLEGVGGVAALNQADGVHPTAQGHSKVAAHVFAFLKSRLKAPAAAAAQAGSKVIRSRKDLKGK